MRVTSTKSLRLAAARGTFADTDGQSKMDGDRIWWKARRSSGEVSVQMLSEINRKSAETGPEAGRLRNDVAQRVEIVKFAS